MPDPNENEAVREEIARRAYLRFCERGCMHGSDTDDWLAAEREVLGEQEKPAEKSRSTKVDPPRRGNARDQR